ncbi:putative dynein [Trypanosoma rangeli]|uniref:Putative dynein n=1 Tax=Trypanosoma rangeli TaxID=5698 RepID=A0A422P1D5_TRYRA|nr:putative dynein [Trypanosoma rangeli]RNF11540.1 putative dynein [Trypanosoma rangeli]|eukprot:RNF11540.1 putative dynein [Trypanosoma rangeli]
MTEVSYSYSRPRREFGRMPEFHANEGEILSDVPPNRTVKNYYTKLDPCETEIQNVPSLSETSTNTERIKLRHRAQSHLEGGWPHGVDPTEFEEKMKYCRKVEREESYLSSCRRLFQQCTDKYIKQNNAIDIYGSYFAEGAPPEDESMGPASAKIISIFKDPNEEKRTAAAISWQNDGRRFAVAYCRLRFQSNTPTTNTNSYLWDFMNPNTPVETLVTPSPLCSIEHYSKDPHIIAGGSWNGVVQYWDTRQPTRPAARSLIEESHKDPVWSIKWLQSKSGELLSVSTDGEVYVWDCRIPDKPLELRKLPDDSLTLLPKNNEGGSKGVLGGLCLDYDPQVGGPSKYMIGTEQGTILSCNRKGKTQADKLGLNTFNAHHGPVYSVQRHPYFSKYFLSVGDWTARMWFEDFKVTPLFSTFYHKSYITSGAWHPVRPGVFFTTRMDGFLDLWDLVLRQSTPALSVQISDYALHTAKPTAEGKYIAAGGIDGNVTLLELSPSLYTAMADEKNVIGQILENESIRDKNLDRALKEKRAVAKQRERRSTQIQSVAREAHELEQMLETMTEEYKAVVIEDKNRDLQLHEELEAQRRRLLEEIGEGIEFDEEE